MIQYGKIIILMLILGIMIGLFAYTFYYGKGFSYLTDNPTACINCHVMLDVWRRWEHSSHREIANCNGCHTPKKFPDKLFVKAINGYRHSISFITETYPQVIYITDFNKKIVEGNCISCHKKFISCINTKNISCILCHSNIGH